MIKCYDENVRHQGFFYVFASGAELARARQGRRDFPHVEEKVCSFMLGATENNQVTIIIFG